MHLSPPPSPRSSASSPEPVTLTFSNLNYTLTKLKPPKRILSDVFGTVSGLTCILGASGAGKTTLVSPCPISFAFSLAFPPSFPTDSIFSPAQRPLWQSYTTPLTLHNRICLRKRHPHRSLRAPALGRLRDAGRRAPPHGHGQGVPHVLGGSSSSYFYYQVSER